MTAHNISENGQYMVSLMDNDNKNDPVATISFKSMQEAEEYVARWNESE